ncbi:HTH_Tnp_Tc3_2 domain-containing protein [Trichonephila clavipes]|uniref:HTH_Tnp_Tc3_2 domain-containing protein n=1 Tax=Trichonephila clavipes TaxID=2585209 RepID=A0A8X6S1N8_TRICX|nr:HTH_Tnp_Tc3_2 domain-containing protein [Trichonephila clavipes]
MSFIRRPGSGCPRQTSRREERCIVRNSRVQPTASSAAIQAQVAPSLGTPVSSRAIRRRLDICNHGTHYVCCLLRLPINTSVWSGTAHEETRLQQNGTRSSLAMNSDSISSVMTIVVNASILSLPYSDTPLPQLCSKPQVLLLERLVVASRGRQLQRMTDISSCRRKEADISQQVPFLGNSVQQRGDKCRGLLRPDAFTKGAYSPTVLDAASR